MSIDEDRDQARGLINAEVLARVRVTQVDVDVEFGTTAHRWWVRIASDRIPLEAITIPTEDEGETAKDKEIDGLTWGAEAAVGWEACDRWWRKRLGLDDRPLTPAPR